jgi:hypothetical protein
MTPPTHANDAKAKPITPSQLHASVSWTYCLGERADEALLRIRKELKTAAGWWNDFEEGEYQAAMRQLGVEP